MQRSQGQRRQSGLAERSADLSAEVAARVCELFEVSPVVLFDGRERAGNVVTARALFFYVMHLRWKHSFNELEQITGFARDAIRDGVLLISGQLKVSGEIRQKAQACGV